ncbi:hemolysin family protein [Fodinicola feengrottensis]|uniref:Hemolysin family protein n=1 Tax=Fodinicola feengrottensis TaxID=435914 RepID=A0ABN2GLL1_9ACTN
MSTTWALLISLLLLAFNAFFVAAEFALVAAKRHRLEAVAATGSRAARAALAASRQLSLMLAGAQLGITLCTLGLGALAKPTVAYLLEPALAAIGLPESAGYVIAFMLAIALVGFLHVVIGEMAPKSWAISDPERSALLLGQPFGWFTRLARPVLAVLNGLANAALRAIKVTPQDELAQAHGPAELRLLLESSRDSGTLPVRDHRLLTSILGLQHTTVDQVMTPIAEVVTIPATAGAREIELTGHRHGRSRLLVTAQDSQITGIVHVRDAARATTNGNNAIASDLMTTPLSMPADTSAAAALRTMREKRSQLSLATDNGTVTGIVAIEDLLEQIIGDFDDETDTSPGPRAPVSPISS